jgi:hypothetical protein
MTQVTHGNGLQLPSAAMNARRAIILGTLTALATALAFTAPLEDALGYQAAFLGLSVAGVLTFFTLAADRRHPIWASISFLFTLSYFIVNLNIPFLRLFGTDVTESIHWFIWTDKDVFNKSVAVSSVGLLCFLLAVAIAKPRRQGRVPQDRYAYSSKSIPALAVTSLILFLATSGTYALGDYSGIGSSSLSSYFYKMFKVSMTALILIKVAGFVALADQIRTFRAYLAHLGKPLLVTLVPFLLITFIAGDRGPLLFFALLTFGPYWARRSGLGFLATALAVYLMSMVFSILGAARQARFEGGNFFERIFNEIASGSVLYHQSFRFDEPVLFGHTIELATSVRVLNHVIANVPSIHDYGFGVFAIQQIASIVPGLSGIINKIFFNGDWKMDGSANFVTYLIQGAHPQYGDGTSVTGELYLDFGIYGVMFGLFLFGLLVGRHENNLFANSGRITFGWVFCMSYFANALYLARSSLLLELSNVILVFLLLKFATRRRVVSVSATQYPV